MFDRFQVRALAGPLMDIQRLVPKPLMRCLGCVLKVIVLLEGEPLPQSEVLSALEQVSSRISLVLKFIFAYNTTSIPVPPAEKHTHSMMLPPQCFTVGMVPGFLQTSSILVSSDQRILFLMVWESFWCLLANSMTKWVVMCLLQRSGFRLATLPWRPDWCSAAEMVVLLEVSPIFTDELWSSVTVTITFLVTCLTKALLPLIAQFRKSLGGSSI